MANLCENIIYIKGPATSLKKFDDQFKQKHTVYHGGTIYNAEPASLEKEKKNWMAYRKKEKGCTHLDTIIQEEGYSFTNFVEMTKDDFLNGWQDWAKQNWGAKWDVDSPEVYVNGLNEIENALTHRNADEVYDIYYAFNTAWSPAEPVVRKMAEQFPDLEFKHVFLEEGAGFAGVVVYHEGEELTRDESKNSDYRAFIHEHIDPDRYTKCPHCGEFLEEYEIEENENECPECENPVAIKTV